MLYECFTLRCWSLVYDSTYILHMRCTNTALLLNTYNAGVRVLAISSQYVQILHFTWYQIDGIRLRQMTAILPYRLCTHVHISGYSLCFVDSSYLFHLSALFHTATCVVCIFLENIFTPFAVGEIFNSYV